jgi:hypothetical protein
MIAPHPLPARGAATAPDHRLRALAVCSALLTTGLLWLASQALGVTLMIDLQNGKPPQLFGPVFLLSFTLLFSLLGWGTLVILEHLTRWALPLWTGLGVVVLVGSLEPITSVGATGSAKAVLATIHLSVAAVLITAMRRSAVRGTRAATATPAVHTQGAADSVQGAWR